MDREQLPETYTCSRAEECAEYIFKLIVRGVNVTHTRALVQIQTFNPYEARYPGLKCVSRETLHLIKTIRAEGYRVIFIPEDDRPLMYITEKGIKDFLSDPLILFVIGIPITIILGLVNSYIYDNLKVASTSSETHVSIEIDERGRRLRYDHKGQPISEIQFQTMLRALEIRQTEYALSLTGASPDPTRPYPIYLEHTGRIIGWGNISQDEIGLRVDNIKIADNAIQIKVQRGQLSGFSIGGIVEQAECSICHRSYTECNHIAGNTYDTRKCHVTLQSVRVAEISVVKDPVNPLTTIEKKLR